jgi:hypothetical protein
MTCIEPEKNSRIEECKEILSEVQYPVLKGSIRDKFGPFETKAFLIARVLPG